MRISLSDHASINSGNDKNLRVCPVGAVSKTITSHVGSSTWRSNSSNAIASSNPGNTISDVFISPFISAISSLALGSNIIPRPPRPLDEFIFSIAEPTFGNKEDILASGSISSPQSPSTPSIAVTSLPISTPRESEVECAGSLDTSNTRNPESASQTAVADEVVVLPTPPLPPNNNSRAILSCQP